MENNLEWRERRLPALIEETGFAPVETVPQEGFLWLFHMYFVSAYALDDPTGEELE